MPSTTDIRKRKRRSKRLTIGEIKTLTQPGMYADGGMPTLFLRVNPSGSKQWVQRIFCDGRQIALGLGGLNYTTLEEARDKAYATRKAIRNGGNPVAERKRRASMPTFAEAVEKVIALHAPTWKNPKQKRQEWTTSFSLHVLPVLGDMRVSDIEAKDVLRVVSPIWLEKNETAQKVKRRISAVLDWSVTHGFRRDNPVSSLAVSLPKFKGKGNFKMIPHEDVAAAIAKTSACTAYTSTKACFEFSVLTAVRSQEARGMQWDELDLDKRIWEVPGERTKTNRAFRIPLSHRAMDILTEQKQIAGDSPLVFPSPSGKVMSDATVSKMVRVCGIPAVPHGFRASFRSWCADMNINREIAELSLGHVVAGVEGRYQRSDVLRRRAVVMQKWSDYLSGTEAKGTVVNLH